MFSSHAGFQISLIVLAASKKLHSDHGDGILLWSPCASPDPGERRPARVAMPTNPRVYFDIQIGTRAGGRVTFELFTDVPAVMRSERSEELR